MRARKEMGIAIAAVFSGADSEALPGNIEQQRRAIGSDDFMSGNYDLEFFGK